MLHFFGYIFFTPKKEVFCYASMKSGLLISAIFRMCCFTIPGNAASARVES